MAAGVAEAKRRDAQLLIVRHVPVENDDAGVHHHVMDIEADLERLKRELIEQGVSCGTTWSVGPGKASRSIIALVEQERPELVVLGIRHHSAVGKLVSAATHRTSFWRSTRRCSQ